MRRSLEDAALKEVAMEEFFDERWVTTDDGIINCLKTRYIRSDYVRIELKILTFEKSWQGDESVRKYLARLKVFARNAYPRDCERVFRQRVVQRFLFSVSDVRVREVLEGLQWMRDDSEALEFEELLTIAEKAEKKNKPIKALENKSLERTVSFSEEKPPLVNSEVINEVYAAPLPFVNETVPLDSPKSPGSAFCLVIFDTATPPCEHEKCEHLSPDPFFSQTGEEVLIVPRFSKKMKFCWHCRAKHSGNGFRCFLRTLWK